MQITKFTYFYPDKAKVLLVNQPLFESLGQDPNWTAQKKYNGNHLLLHYFENEFQFWNRHHQKLTYKPSKEVIHALKSLSLQGYWIFDGELRHNKVKGVQHKIVLWDIFIAKNKLLNTLPYASRITILEELMPSGIEVLKTPETFAVFNKELYEEAIKDEEIEGLVLKNLTGRLLLGRTKGEESPWMFKVRKETGRHKF